MIITAKFSSTCPKCGGNINAGSQVEWSKGARATHVLCPASGGRRARAIQAAAAERRTTEPTIEQAPWTRTEKWAPCKRAALPDTTGDVRVVGAFKRAWATLRQGATGEPIVEGDALIVVAQAARYESAEQNEDMGDMSGPGWHVTLYLRRATAEEAAPARERVAAAQAKKNAAARRSAQLKELDEICRTTGWISCDNDAKRPSGREITLETDTYGAPRRVAVLSEDGLGVAVWDAGYYDDWRWTLHVSRDPRAVALFLELEGKVVP